MKKATTPKASSKATKTKPAKSLKDLPSKKSPVGGRKQEQSEK